MLSVVVLPHGEGLPLPRYETPYSAGMDLRAALPEDTKLIIFPTERAAVPTGICLSIPPQYEGQVRPRSGLAFRQGLSIINSPGTIDADYRGEIKVLLINHGRAPIEITRGMRIAQLVICPIMHVNLVEVDVLEDTFRGDGGFGSTGEK
tara:strand:+ start:801 stop:1247 length:447 start_codon:yes stop_codon:yes gene_type:complete